MLKHNLFLAVILGKSHYLLYVLATAMQPRWLVTLDDNLQPLNVSVRVGQVSNAALVVTVFYKIE